MLTIDDEIRIRGCEPVTKIIIPDQELQELVNYLSELPITKQSFIVHPMFEKDILIDGQAFFNEYFKLHKVPHLKAYKIPILNYDIYRIKYVHPYELPIDYEEGDYNGSLNEIITLDERIIFKSLTFNEKPNELTSSFYVHEITHAELNSLKGSYRNFFNQEIISIFLELIHAKDISKNEDILRIHDANRVQAVIEFTKQQVEFATGRLDLPREEQIDNSKYIQSILIAFRLYAIYYFSHYSIQKEMLMRIQDIFNGKITVEDYLEAFGISFENSQDKKILGKYLNRIV